MDVRLKPHASIWGGFANQESEGVCMFHWLASMRHRGGSSLVCLCSGVREHCWCVREWRKRPRCLLWRVQPAKCRLGLYLWDARTTSLLAGPGNENSSKQTERRNLLGLGVLIQPALSKVVSVSFVWRLSAKYVTVLLTQGRAITSFWR